MLRCLSSLTIACKVLVKQDSSCRWPRPTEVMGFTTVEVRIENLQIDLNALAKLDGSGGCCARKWLKCVIGKEFFGHDFKMSIDAFLRAVAGMRQVAPLVGQLVWGIAIAIDRE